MSRTVLLAGFATSSVTIAAAVASIRAAGIVDEVVVERFAEVRTEAPSIVVPSFQSEVTEPAYLRLPRHRKKRRRS